MNCLSDSVQKVENVLLHLYCGHLIQGGACLCRWDRDVGISRAQPQQFCCRAASWQWLSLKSSTGIRWVEGVAALNGVVWLHYSGWRGSTIWGCGDTDALKNGPGFGNSNNTVFQYLHYLWDVLSIPPMVVGVAEAIPSTFKAEN